MRSIGYLAVLGALALVMAGCHRDPPLPDSPVPSSRNPDAAVYAPAAKPLPEQEYYAGPPPFVDEPLVEDVPPEAGRFAALYARVGRPRIAVFVNRTLEGQIAAAKEEPAVRVEHTRTSDAGVTVESRTTRRDGFGRTVREGSDRFDSKGPARYRESAAVYLSRGQYDEVQAKSIDYELIENRLTDWLSAGGQVELISPTMARKKLTDEEIKDLQAGKPRALSEVAQKLDCEVLIQAQARPTRQTQHGLEVRIIAEAFNIKGGQSIARAAVDVPPPLEKPRVNYYTRYLARALMNGMSNSWAPLGGATTQPAPGAAGSASPER